MFRNRTFRVTITAVSILFIGCYSAATIKIHVDPSIQSYSVRSVAILPISNVQLPPVESREIIRAISNAFKEKNPKVKILDPGQSIDLIIENKLLAKYNDFLRKYIMTGNPDVSNLREIGKALDVDAILQGIVFDIRQSDASFAQWAQTNLTVSYSLFSTHDGKIIWDAASRASKWEVWAWDSAPPLHEAISVALEEIIKALPTLGK